MKFQTTRKIGNEVYKKRGNTSSYTEAQRMADRLRNDGHKVRVLKSGDGYIIVAKSK